MASWVTHLMIADSVLEVCPGLHRRGFCVGNIAPDCNVENEDWTQFTPPREVTHWMTGERKKVSDCEGFRRAYLAGPGEAAGEERAFLLGYYAHLLTDGAYQQMIRDEARVQAVWRRIKACPELSARAAGLPETWDTVKKLLPRWKGEVWAMEGEYLQKHPDSGYLTEILPLKEFPDYLDYLPTGAIARKISVMGYLPQSIGQEPVAISREEFSAFVEETVAMVIAMFRQWGLV